MQNDHPDLSYGGQAPGPESLPPPRSRREAERRERIWIYHEQILRGMAIKFVPDSEILARPGARRRRRLDAAKIQASTAQLQALLKESFPHGDSPKKEDHEEQGSRQERREDPSPAPQGKKACCTANL